MNAMQILAAQPWVERLALTLLHFLWEGALLAALYAAARKWGKRTSGPNGRYLLACAALTAMAIAPAVTWMLLRTAEPQSVAATFAAPMSAAPSWPAASIPTLLPSHVDRAVPAPFLPWVVVLWLTGVTA